MHDFEEKKLKNAMGIDAVVERVEHKGELMGRANAALKDIGNFIKSDCEIAQLKEAEYLGSAAVHIFYLPFIQQPIFISQTDPMGQIHEFTASESFKQLQNDLRAHYGRNRVTRRSGA